MTIARCFIALDLGEEALAASAAAQELLDADVVRKSAPESMHLTIKFLGHVDVDAVARKVFDALAPHASPIALGQGKIEGFPSIARARVVVLACDGARLAELAFRAEKAAFVLGVPLEDRPYRPHLTLARCKNDFDARKIAARFSPRALGFATQLVLYESAGGKYHALASSACPGSTGSALL